MELRRIRDLREDSNRARRQTADYPVMNLDVCRRYETGEREIPVWARIKPAKYCHVGTDYFGP